MSCPTAGDTAEASGVRDPASEGRTVRTSISETSTRAPEASAPGRLAPGRLASGPSFDESPPDGGYRWHYIDAVTEDGELGIVLIAMIGNVFSPHYARARTRGGDLDPWRYTSMNIAVYGRDRSQSAWAFEERSQPRSSASPNRLELGRSSLEWIGGRLVATLDERTTPLDLLGVRRRRPVRGRVVFHPETVCGTPIDLDPAGEHRWWPMAPVGWVEVDLTEPRLKFAAYGYLDANRGSTPLDRSFDRWCWARARTRAGAVIAYDVTLSDGASTQCAFRIGNAGTCDPVELVRSPLGRTGWGIPQHAATQGPPPVRVRTLEDGPFYAREVQRALIGGERTTVLHETLSARRLRQSWVQFCTGYRMRFE